MRENDFFCEVAKYINYIDANYEVTLFKHNANINGYTTRIKDTAKRINSGKGLMNPNKSYDLVIEMHFNAFNKHANGCETLYYYASKKGRNYAKQFSELVNERTGIKLRNNGLRALSNRKDRGFASVYYTNAPTILIEPFFGDNIEDCKKIKSPENMANIINEFLNTL